MKKIGLLASLLVFSSATFAQSAYDALSINQMDPILGTARYSAMAGAFGALGGNASVSKDNPAGLGVYKKCDLTFTPSLYVDNDADVGFSLDNFALIVNFRNTGKEHGYVTSSLGITYNRLRNYSRYTAVANKRNSSWSITDVMGDDATSDVIYDNAVEFGLLSGTESEFGKDADYVDKNVRFKESGHAGQWDISYGLNISNRVYVGATMGIANFLYRQKAFYNETAAGDEMYLNNYLRSDGIGVNFKLGGIVRATDFLRVGFAIHTPTFYNVDETYAIEMDYNKQHPDRNVISEGFYNYDMNSPFKMQASLGFVIAKRALIGVEYGLENYSKMKLVDTEFDMKMDGECEIISEKFDPSHQLKFGAEVKVIDEFALRAGFAFLSSPIDAFSNKEANYGYFFRPMSLPHETYYITAGAGYEGEHFYCDLAYVFRNQKSSFYQILPLLDGAWSLNQRNHNVMLSLGWRF